MSKPVILISAARSGTKFLRGVLSASESVYSVPYDVNYVWRYGNESFPNDELPQELATPQVTTYVRKTLAKMAKIPSCDRDAILLEKSVPNSLRVSFVNRVYPEARFIHLLRDGRDVVESSMRQWRSTPDWRYLLNKARQFPLKNYKYGLWFIKNVITGTLSSSRGAKVWGPRYSGVNEDATNLQLVEICSKQWVACVENSIAQLGALQTERYHVIRYENLVSNDLATKDLCNYLNISDTDAVVNRYHKVVERNMSGQWRTRLCDEEIDVMLRIITPTLQKCGYV